MVTVTTSPADLTGVTVTYTQDNVAVAAPTAAGSYTVTATLDNPNYTATNATGTLVINQATPTITWSNPADITYGTPLGRHAARRNGVRRGHLRLHTGRGHVLNAGDAQELRSRSPQPTPSITAPSRRP